MGRVFTVARSEFVTAVRARGFLIGIMLMPILFGGAVLLQRVVDQQANGIPRHVAVIDDTGELYSRLSEAAAAWNRGERDTGPRVTDGPTFTLGAGDTSRRSRGPAAGALRARPRRRSCLRSSRSRPGLLRGDGSATAPLLLGAPRPIASCPTGCSARS